MAVRRELKNNPVSSRIPSSIYAKLVKECERKGCTVSQYIAELIKKDVLDEK